MADGNEGRRAARKPDESRRGSRQADRRQSERQQGARQETERQSSGTPATRAAIDELMLDRLLAAAGEASEGLAKHLMGVTIIRLRDVRREFLFEWKESGPTVAEISGHNVSARNVSSRDVSARDVLVRGASGEEVLDRDVSGEAPRSPESVDDEGRVAEACVITTDAVHMLNIASGQLNPQIAMLSEKIEVSGRVGPALYFFNLIS